MHLTINYSWVALSLSYHETRTLSKARFQTDLKPINEQKCATYLFTDDHLGTYFSGVASIILIYSGLLP